MSGTMAESLAKGRSACGEAMGFAKGSTHPTGYRTIHNIIASQRVARTRAR